MSENEHKDEKDKQNEARRRFIRGAAISFTQKTAAAILDYQREAGEAFTPEKYEAVFTGAIEAWINSGEPLTAIVARRFVNSAIAALEQTNKGRASITKFRYNNTRARKMLENEPQLLFSDLEKRYNLTDEKRQKENGGKPLDILDITLSPIDDERLEIGHKFETDPVFSLLVLDAITTIFKSGTRVFTDLDVARTLTGRTDVNTISTEYRARIAEVIEQARRIMVTLDSEALTIKGKRQKYRARGRLLDLWDLEVTRGNRRVKGYNLRGEPILSALASRTGEEIKIPLKYFDIREIGEGVNHAPYPVTAMRTEITITLLQRIIRMHGTEASTNRYAGKIERGGRRKKGAINAAQASKDIHKARTRADNLQNIRLDTLCELVGAKSTEQKRQVENTVRADLKWWAFSSPELLKGFSVKQVREKNEKTGRYVNTQVFKIDIGDPLILEDEETKKKSDN